MTTPAPRIPPLADGAPLFGAAYYPEYFPPERMPRDLELMSAADVSVIRVGESVWSTWEPRDGEFDVEWLRPTLDEAHRRGISVILGTPTYAMPPWLQRAHPELAAESRSGVRVPWGGRQEMDYASPVFRRYAERVIREVVAAYADHPAVIGYQIDNEPGLHLFHNDHVFARFVDELREEFDTAEALNEAWGLVYWSHRLADFDELWRPDGNTLPQYDLAWRRFQSRLTTEFLGWQAGIVRELARDDQFVTTCLAYSRPTLDDVAVGTHLDVAAANLYYGMQDHLALGVDLPRIAPWTTTGVHGLLYAADRAFGTTQRRFLVTETNAQAIGASDQNYPPYPGQLRQAALALVSRGAAAIEYWHWNTIPYGTETFWGGVLPHSGEPGRVYEEVQRIGRDLRALGPTIEGYEPEHDVTLLYSNASRWAMDFFPPIPGAPSPEHGGAYTVLFTAFHRGVVESGRQARVLNDLQAAALDAAALAAAHPVLVVPGLYVADDALLQLLRDYARAGGHLVLGPRSAVADPAARIRVERLPAGGLAEDAGVAYEEFSNLREPLAVVGWPFTGAVHGTAWIDGLLPTDAETLSRYAGEPGARFAAVTTRAVGTGRITVVGTVPDSALSRELARWLRPEPVAGTWVADDAPVTVSSGRTRDGRVVFLHNWSAHPVTATAPADGTDALTGESVTAGAPLELAPWDARAIARAAP